MYEQLSVQGIDRLDHGAAVSRAPVMQALTQLCFAFASSTFWDELQKYYTIRYVLQINILQIVELYSVRTTAVSQIVLLCSKHMYHSTVVQYSGGSYFLYYRIVLVETTKQRTTVVFGCRQMQR